MLKRKILKDLQEWKEKPDHKSLIITGQRQIGKTYVIEKMFSKEYESFISLNFLNERELKHIFDGNLDIDTLLLNISAASTGAKFIPGKTLLLFDEIQECPNAITSLKFWTEDGRFDVIGMGSSLGIKYKDSFSFPVGKVDRMNMYSLDFEEFLWALGINESVMEALKNSAENLQKIPESTDKQMWNYLKQYMVVGGMPEVVETYLKTKNLSEVHTVQRRLINDYGDDIAHYADANMKIKAEQCYKSIPSQLSKGNHKFQYKEVEKNGRAQKFGSSIEWLKNQLLVIEVLGLKRLEYPLESFADETNFRIYPTDIGILIGMFDESLKKAIIEDKTIEKPSPGLILGTAKGGLYEALAADMLYKSGYSKLFFYKNEKNTSEIEFVIQKGDKIIPIEIKAGREKANSLKNILNDNKHVEEGYKMSSNNIGKSNKLVTMPLYMLAVM